MRILNIILLLSSLSLWLTSCSTVTEPSQRAENQKAPVENRVQSLSSIQNWDLNALIAIRNNAKNNSESVNLQWAQNKQNYSILLFGPLGASSIKLTGHPGNVLLESADGKKVNAKTPEILLAAQTGWDLPVSNLYYWVRGLPVPGVPAQKSYDNYNHLSQLEQQGWVVQFLHYTSMNHIDVPTKIFLNNPQMSVKIIISKWNF